LTNANYTPETVTRTLIISQATVKVGLDSLSVTYDASPKPAAAALNLPAMTAVTCWALRRNG
jgi:hypothetical protein